MSSSTTWFMRLYDVAPCLDGRLFDPLVAILAGPARCDELLHVADALIEVADLDLLRGRAVRAGDLVRVADLFRTEARTRQEIPHV